MSSRTRNERGTYLEGRRSYYTISLCASEGKGPSFVYGEVKSSAGRFCCPRLFSRRPHLLSLIISPGGHVGDERRPGGADRHRALFERRRRARGGGHRERVPRRFICVNLERSGERALCFLLFNLVRGSRSFPAARRFRCRSGRAFPALLNSVPKIGEAPRENCGASVVEQKRSEFSVCQRAPQLKSGTGYAKQA